ncbi:MAG TPA: ABC transporter permease [Bryobacteraceae bacterium]|nr:ABC transporter permease [Bryobacteraceae bacterium]
MQYGKEFWRRVLYLGRRSRFHSELNDELQWHMECRAEELEQSGVPHDEAMARARRDFGSATRAAEDTHDSWRIGWIEDLGSDLRYAGRALRRSPGFALAAMFCLALGIGANATIFSITTSFLFSLPSCREASSLIAIWEGGNSASSIADYKFLRDARIFEGTAGINPEMEVNWRNGEQSTRLFAGAVTDDYFSVLGVPFQLGRGIAPGETTTAVLSHRLWRNRFGSDPGVLGRHVVLDGRPCTIVGVLPADHRNIVGFGFSPDIFVPAIHDDEIVQFYARMPQGMTIPIARERLKSVFRELDRVHPKEDVKRSRNVLVTGVSGMDVLAQEQLGVVVAFFAMLAIVVGLVLLIACTNVAGLLLARASSRSRELAVRLSLGASRMRIVRHLLAESLLLSSLGATAGLLIDFVCAHLASSMTLPLPVPIQLVVAPDWRLLLFSICMVLLSALVCGLLPALKAVRKDVNITLKRDQQQVERAWGLRSVLITGQIAISTVLLATGFLFLHNLRRATSMNPGFDLDHTIWAYMRLVPENYKDQSRQMALVRQALERLRSLPGVQAAAITRRVPLNDNCVIGTDDLTTDLSATPMDVDYQCNNVGPDYFHAIGIPLLQGREFTAQDRKGSQQVAIVNEAFARLVFGNRNPVGHTITRWKVTFSIVGVVKDSKYFTLGERQRLALYEPYFAREEPVNLNFIVRTAGAPSGLAKPIGDALAQLDSSAAVETKPMVRALGLALLPSQFGAAMLGAMGILSLALAAIGLYGILLYSVSRRTREIGLRMALGATPAVILRTICRSSFGLVGAGLTIGLTLAFLGTRPLAMFLVPGLSSSDPAAFGAVIAVLGMVAVLATLIPAIRALRVDPMTALRYE